MALPGRALAACATGSAIVTGHTRDPVAPEQVKIYVEPPAAFEIIGVVSASSDMGLTEQLSVDYAIGELKKQAAKVGANGVLLGDTTTSVARGVNATKTIQGKAIVVKGQEAIGSVSSICLAFFHNQR